MPRKPAASAYILALTLRNVVRKNEERMEKVRKANQYYRLLNAKLIENGCPQSLWFQKIRLFTGPASTRN